mmetsp:Transcript_21495/g.40134  ORF Transcript_21495/g.40134 Transcript_21495/m.40134 type:complete len:147 (+) Transcript_21495:162-602(+)
MGSPEGHSQSKNPYQSNGSRGLTEHQKQAIILMVLSLVIYAACQFETTLNFMVAPSIDAATAAQIEGPKPDTHIAMIALLGERNSGTRWTTDHLIECFNHSIEVRLDRGILLAMKSRSEFGVHVVLNPLDVLVFASPPLFSRFERN